ncbi:MAG: hypothetical protein F4Y63_09960 [Chloroflexi bacterium]|nr:hypothetical protein [Chloroflexota bacterium]MYF78925.1 hypothetical protein [Chloroflexota bacterium]MYK62143.1 hypothetical protein [Chloroflexota bacterium]
MNGDIRPVTYSIASLSDASACEWGRLDHREGVEDQVVESGSYTAGATVAVLPEDDVCFTFGRGT